MPDLVIICPSRGRPEQAHDLVQRFNNTTTTRPRLVFAVGEDDPTLPEYAVLLQLTLAIEVNICQGPPVDRPSTMNYNLNGTTSFLAQADDAPFALGFMGDDHRPATYGWDAKLVDALRELGTGIAYGDDLLQGEALPTAVAMTTDIVRALGHMAPPELWHMYVDNYWRDLGRAAGCLRYLPDVVIEHMHPLAGKAAVDDSYRRSNAFKVYGHDQRLYERYCRSGRLAADVKKVRALRAVDVAAEG